MTRGALRVLRVIVAVSVAAARAYGQADDGSAIAEQLTIQARNLATANQWAEACARFEDSLRYNPALATRMELAACDEHIGKLARAWSQYRASIEPARQAGDTARRDAAENRAAALEPRLARIMISPPQPTPAGFTVAIDGAALDAAALGGTYVDAGAHQITASAPGRAAIAQTVALSAGRTAKLVIAELAPAPVAAAAEPGSPAPPVPAGEPPAPPRTRAYLGMALGAAGVVAAGFGLVFGANARTSYQDAQALCGADLVCDAASYPRGKQLISETRSRAALSTALIAGGGAAIVTGVVLVLTAPRAAERATARIVPLVPGRGAGLAVVGSF